MRTMSPSDILPFLITSQSEEGRITSFVTPYDQRSSLQGVLSHLSTALKKNALPTVGRHIEYRQDNIKIIAFIKLLVLYIWDIKTHREQRNMAIKAYLQVVP